MWCKLLNVLDGNNKQLTYIAYDGKFSKHLQYLEPDTDVLGPEIETVESRQIFCNINFCI